MIASQHRAAGSQLVPGFGAKIKGMCAVQWPSAGNTPAAWDWAGHWKPQIDAVVALGGNCIKLYNNFQATVDGGQGQANYTQFLDYVAAKGLMFYAQTNTPAISQVATLGIPYYVNIAVTQAAVLNGYRNVIGYDLINEINGLGEGSGGFSFSLAQSLLSSMITACRTVTSIPLTSSITLNNRGNLTDSWAAMVNGMVDFIDYHPYLSTSEANNGELGPADITPLRSRSWWKPFIIGESGQSLQATLLRQNATWVANGAISSLADCYGSMGFCVEDYQSSPQFGFYDGTMNLAAPRQQFITPYQAWPGWS